MNITVYCGARPGKGDEYAACASELGSWIGRNGHSLVYGGGKVGLMGVLADAVLKAGGKAYGVIPRFLVERETAHRGLTRLTVVETMSERKKLMMASSDAFIALPGGTGTLEEITEVMSLVRLRRLHKPCILYNHRGFYDPLKSLLDRMAEDGFFTPETLPLCFAEDLNALSSYLLHWYLADFAEQLNSR